MIQHAQDLIYKKDLDFFTKYIGKFGAKILKVEDINLYISYVLSCGSGLGRMCI